MPYGDASADMVKGLDGSKWVRTVDDCWSCFVLSKAFCCGVDQFHLDPFCSNLYRGESIEERLGINLL